MAKGNFNGQGKRQREAAKRDKRAAKDAKRAQRKAERAASNGGAPVLAGVTTPAAAPVSAASKAPAVVPAPAKPGLAPLSAPRRLHFPGR